MNSALFEDEREALITLMGHLLSQPAIDRDTLLLVGRIHEQFSGPRDTRPRKEQP